jgi:NAD(P)-dependent dehydrogenase (short-subunit alcohol dehydrogenase family)
MSLSEKLGPRVAVVGASRGLGLAVVTHVLENAADSEVLATYRSSPGGLEDVDGKRKRLHLVGDVDVSMDTAGDDVVAAAKKAGWSDISSLIFVAGILAEDTLDEPKPQMALKMYDVCALGPLRVVSGLVSSGMLREGGKVGLVTSEGGSIGMRGPREGGANYGHHASKAAENMVGRLLALDLEEKGVAVVNIHPGFMKSEMTEHYAEAYSKLGAIEPEDAAPGVVEAVARVTMEDSGRFVAPLGSESLGFGVFELPDTVPPFGNLPW